MKLIDNLIFSSIIFRDFGFAMFLMALMVPTAYAVPLLFSLFVCLLESFTSAALASWMMIDIYNEKT